MSKSKAIFVTAIMALMLAVILVFSYMIEPKVHTALALLLAVYGFSAGAAVMCRWLQKTPKEPQHLDEGDMWQHDDEYADPDTREGNA